MNLLANMCRNVGIGSIVLGWMFLCVLVEAAPWQEPCLNVTIPSPSNSTLSTRWQADLQEILRRANDSLQFIHNNITHAPDNRSLQRELEGVLGELPLFLEDYVKPFPFVTSCPARIQREFNVTENCSLMIRAHRVVVLAHIVVDHISGEESNPWRQSRYQHLTVGLGNLTCLTWHVLGHVGLQQRALVEIQNPPSPDSIWFNPDAAGSDNALLKRGWAVMTRVKKVLEYASTLFKLFSQEGLTTQ